jgi:alpha-beta hydrolase superfamily lysophospholipase
MAAWTAIKNQPESAAATPAAMPVTFAGTVGLFTPASIPPASTAVLFLSPWGFEEMCVRKFWRILAEDLADAGIASLRFDYAGTGDALDATDHHQGLDLWRDTALAAASLLTSLSGCDRLILISQGLGSAIAIDIADRLPSVDGIAFLAPMISGRFYLRELAVWSKMIDEGMGLNEHQRESEGVTVASLRMPETIAAAVRKLNLMTTPALHAPDSLVLKRPGRPGDEEFASHLQTLGTRVEQSAYDGYDELVSNPTVATMPLDAGKRVLAWANEIVARRPAMKSRKILRAPRAQPLIGDGFRETPLRLGEGDRMFGVLCEPLGPRTGATAILLTTAYDRHAGWGRTSVTMARRLARSGIASLRFDTANVADSPPNPGAPDQVLYSESQNADVTAAFDLVEVHKLLPAFVVGRCSGGYLAFKGAVRDRRCSGVIAVNAYAFHWDQTQSVEEALRFVPRSLETYGQKFLQLETLKRLYEGSIDARSAARNIMASLARRVSRLGRPFLDTFPFLSKDPDIITAGFEAMQERNVEVSLVYSAHDIGLEQFYQHFGPGGAGLALYPNARLTIIPDADHNLTPPHARDIYVKEIQAMSLRLGAPRPSRVDEEAAIRPPKYAGYPTP